MAASNLEDYVSISGNVSANGTLTVSGTSYGYISYPGVYNPDAKITIRQCNVQERQNRMALYTVYLVHIKNRNIVKTDVVAKSELDAYLKAFTGALSGVLDIDEWDKHAEHIFDLTEDDDE